MYLAAKDWPDGRGFSHVDVVLIVASHTSLLRYLAKALESGSRELTKTVVSGGVLH